MQAVKNKSEKNNSKNRLNGKNGNLIQDIEASVKDRYAKGALQKEDSLCCPVNYDAQYLKVIPKEIIERDYGCGDPSRYVKEGETVLDLGSGGGKICYITSQIVGPKGKVIGVDFNPTMLALARKYKDSMAKKIGWGNVEFLRGKIQDLQTPQDEVETYLERNPIKSLEDYSKFEMACSEIRKKKTLVKENSIDVIVSNCVLNLVRKEDRKAMFKEMFRVLKRGGRVAISDIVSDEVVPQELQDDQELWSGCISGAFQEKEFIEEFEAAGFYGVRVDKWDEQPWKTVKGIEFRSVTITAYEGKEGDCWERNQAVIYKGPWKQVVDDDKHTLIRGMRTAVCDKTFQIYSKEPYSNEMVLISPKKNIPLSKAKPFDCKGTVERHPKETKGAKFKSTNLDNADCGETSCC